MFQNPTSTASRVIPRRVFESAADAQRLGFTNPDSYSIQPTSAPSFNRYPGPMKPPPVPLPPRPTPPIPSQNHPGPFDPPPSPLPPRSPLDNASIETDANMPRQKVNPWNPGAGMGYNDVLESIFGRMGL